MATYKWESIDTGQQGKEEFLKERLSKIVEGKYGLGEETVAEIWEDKEGNYSLVVYEDDGGDEEIIHRHSGAYDELKKKAESSLR